MIKKILFPIVILFIAFTAYGQSNYFPSTGNVGIGIGTGSSAPLHVLGETRMQGDVRLQSLDGNDAGFIRTTGDAGSSNGISLQANRGSGYISFWTKNSGNSEKMRVQNNGNVGIGVMSPSHKLHVGGSGRFNDSSSSYTKVNSNGSGSYMWQYKAAGIFSWLTRDYSGTYQAEFRHGGIGANETVEAKEVNVTASGWADYVFDNGNSLMTVEQVLQFYSSYGHLENIPLEKGLLKNGVNLSEMKIKLLEMVEELILYLVRQNERIKAMLAKLDEFQL
ncbi:hypothetical protein SAMN04489724_3067 [Algoriphagus locisalis]|uniref:Peptidase S74 domain-containing protein n=1 Tax=Algoriphagus locisalis TaxID=305507 RepID=A0A1I7CCS3_9BACT|nr:hypothetical protein [Algoriphagus locisalis]SFT97174.1 hypothetical protein SAMN04489724_3067 [Algoriphagus locisalis]